MSPDSAPQPTAEGEDRSNALRVIGSWLRGAFLHNAALKFVSLVLAVTLFILVNTNKEAIIGVNVGISYELPEDRVLVSERMDQVRLTIKGPWRRIERFDERELDRIHVDLTNMRSGPYTFSEDAIKLPDGLALLSINPTTIPIAFERRVQKTVPVTVPMVGEPARGYKVARILAKPSRVTIRGAESAVRAIENVATRELSIEGRTESFSEVLRLETPRTTPRGLVEIADNGLVEVGVELAEEMSTRRVHGIPVQIIAGPGFTASFKGRFSTDPAIVDVVLHGPLLVIESFQEELVAYVTVHAEDMSGKPRQASVQIANVPDGVGIEIKPDDVMLRDLRD
jgi:YbbR domain-containing protein